MAGSLSLVITVRRNCELKGWREAEQSYNRIIAAAIIMAVSKRQGIKDEPNGCTKALQSLNWSAPGIPSQVPSMMPLINLDMLHIMR